jgi:hypothetical protein
MIFAMDLIYKILISTPNYSTDNIAREFSVYDNSHDYYRYDSAALPEETFLLIEHFLEHCGYIDVDGYHQYTKDPGAIVVEWVNDTFPLSNVERVFLLMFSNFSVWLLVGPLGMRLIMFVEKEYMKFKPHIPTPDRLIEHRLTGRTEFYEIGEYYFLDENLG